MKNITSKNIIAIGLTTALLLLTVTANIWSAPIFSSNTIDLKEHVVNEQRLNILSNHKQSGLTLDPENMPEGLTLLE